MGIQSLQIKGFRSLKDVTWTPGKLNVLIGPNGSGKSNLLRAVRLLQQSAAGTLPEEMLRLGGMAPVLWDGSATELSWNLKVDPVMPKKHPQRDALTYNLTLRQLGTSSTYRVEQETLANLAQVESGQRDTPIKLLERDPQHATTFDANDLRLTAHEGSVPEDQTLLSLVAGPFGNPVILAFRNDLLSWSIYHDCEWNRAHRSASRPSHAWSAS